MTTTTPVPADTEPSGKRTTMTRVGGAAALLAAGTFGYGIAMFVTTFAD